jgi:2-polyprenyl-3-methyl-5-hydroxy-6-metoxy-1,4-benzoquinol methylase
MKANKTNEPDYCEKLLSTNKLWKKILNVQYPYRRSLEKMKLGKTIDIGCGIGRVLTWLPENSVGVDHNPTSIEICLSRGLNAYTTEGFQEAVKLREIEVKTFDNLLLAHVLEHLEPGEQREIIEFYLPYLKKNGGIFIITPQEVGYRSDITHVTFTDFDRIRKVLMDLNFEVTSQKSFPFPRAFGKFFKYNEFHTYAKLKS